MKITGIKSSNNYKLLALQVQPEKFGMKFEKEMCRDQVIKTFADYNFTTNELTVFGETPVSRAFISFKACLKAILEARTAYQIVFPQ